MRSLASLCTPIAHRETGWSEIKCQFNETQVHYKSERLFLSVQDEAVNLAFDLFTCAQETEQYA